MLPWVEIGDDIVFLRRARRRHDTDSGALSALLIINMDVLTAKKMLQNLKVENYVLFIRLSEDFKPRKENSQITLRSCSEEGREGRIYRSFVTKPGSWNTKRLLLIKENQMSQASLGAQKVKSLPAEPREAWVRSLGWEDPLEEGMATYSSIPALRIPMDREAHWIKSIGSQKVGHGCD